MIKGIEESNQRVMFKPDIFITSDHSVLSETVEIKLLLWQMMKSG